MLQSKFFLRIEKNVPPEEKSINAKLLIRAGFINKLMAGVYTLLPLGLRVYRKIENIIREEIENVGGQEISMPALHPKEIWEKTGRWREFAGREMFKVRSQSGKDYGLGWTHEEVVTPLAKNFIKSYKDLPLYIYQIQDKFRDELRVKSGILRCREFTMKDLYSFHRDEKDLDEYYEKVKAAYFKIFERAGLKEKTYLTLASGGSFSKYSHEFQTITPNGEDEICICKKCKIAINKEIMQSEKDKCPECGGADFEFKKAIEVGNIFKLKDKYSKPFNLTFRDKDGKEKIALMGCYGIGLGRLMGAIVESHYDENGIIWPELVSPFDFHLITLNSKDASIQNKIKESAEKVYRALQKQGLEVIYDNRGDKSAGEKFVESDLIGIPKRIVVSERTLAKDCVEIKERGKKEVKLVKFAELLNKQCKHRGI